MRLKFDKSLYDKQVLLRAAYSFIDRVYIHIEQDQQYWYVSWKPKDSIDIDSAMFENELITQALRTQVLRETSEIRKLALARAFASTIIDTAEIRTFGAKNDPVKEYTGSEERILQGWHETKDHIV